MMSMLREDSREEVGYTRKVGRIERPKTDLEEKRVLV